MECSYFLVEADNVVPYLAKILATRCRYSEIQLRACKCVIAMNKERKKKCTMKELLNTLYAIDAMNVPMPKKKKQTFYHHFQSRGAKFMHSECIYSDRSNFFRYINKHIVHQLTKQERACQICKSKFRTVDTICIDIISNSLDPNYSKDTFVHDSCYGHKFKTEGWTPSKTSVIRHPLDNEVVFSDDQDETDDQDDNGGESSKKEDMYDYKNNNDDSSSDNSFSNDCEMPCEDMSFEFEDES